MSHDHGARGVRGFLQGQILWSCRSSPMCRMNGRILVPIAALIWFATAYPRPCPAETLEIGSPAPDFRLPGVDGKRYTLDSFREAEILVVAFTCNHCPTAQAYEDRIKQLATDYKDKK